MVVIILGDNQIIVLSVVFYFTMFRLYISFVYASDGHFLQRALHIFLKQIYSHLYLIFGALRSFGEM